MKTTVRRRTGQPLTHLCYYKATALVWAHRTTDLFQHHSRVFRAAIDRLHRSLPRLTCLRTVELHLQPFNLGLESAWHGSVRRRNVLHCAKWRRRPRILLGLPLHDDDDDDTSNRPLPRVM